MKLTHNLHAFLWTSPSANNCNTYLIQSSQKNILIDPGHAAYFDHVRKGLHQLNLEMDDIDLLICTHAHPDHIEAVSRFDTSATLFAIHETEWQMVQELAPYLKQAMSMDLDQFRPDFFLAKGQLTVGDIMLEVFHTPGHSPGSATLYYPDAKALITGDLIFKDGVGRTDLPGGNSDQLKDSIRRMAALDSDWLLSGHGDVLSGKDAVRANFERVDQMWFGFV